MVTFCFLCYRNRSYLRSLRLRWLLQDVVVPVWRPYVPAYRSAIYVYCALWSWVLVLCGIASVVVLINHVVVGLAALRVRLLKESIIPQLIGKRLDLGVDTWQRHPSEVSEVLSDGNIQWVRTVENVWVSLEVSSHRWWRSNICTTRVQEVFVVMNPWS